MSNSVRENAVNQHFEIESASVEHLPHIRQKQFPREAAVAAAPERCKDKAVESTCSSPPPVAPPAPSSPEDSELEEEELSPLNARDAVADSSKTSREGSRTADAINGGNAIAAQKLRKERLARVSGQDS